MSTISSKEIRKQYHSKKSIFLAAWPAPLLITFQAELGETLRKAPNDDPLKARPAEGRLWPSVNDGNDAIADHFQLNWFVLSVRAQECIHCLKAWRSPIHSLR